MLASEELLDDLAGAVLDGSVVDWAAAESTAEGAAKPLVRHLRLVASVARLHRDVLPTATFSGPILQEPVVRDRWGHLKLFERVGRGAYGEVFRAWDTRLDREVALKLLPAAQASQSSAPSSIIREGRLLAKVRHPNVVTIHGAEQIGDEIGLWMEFVRGRTLELLVKQNAAFRSPEAVTIGLELCRAVSAVHGAGLLHRDIKAQNVVRADDGRIVLMDFGTGRELDDSSASDLAGTPLYLAPEVLAGGPATVQSDIYSLGVLLYHLLTGSYPVRGRTIRDVRRAHQRHERIALRTARPEVRPALARVIERATNPDAAARQQSAQALTADLKALAGTFTTRWVKYIAAAAAVLVVAAGVTLANGWRPFGRQAAFPRVVVIPFENLGAQPDHDAFTIGLTSEIQRHLAGVKGITPLSYSWSAALLAKGKTLREIADELHADLVLSGSIFRAGDVLRINARLVQVADNVVIWNESFDRKLSDVFTVQDDISKAIVTRLSLKAHWQRQHVTTVELQDLFLRARAVHARRDQESALNAVALYEQVVAADPAYAPAWAGLAIALATAERRARELPVSDRMEAAALRAIELDENLAEAQLARALVFVRARSWKLAEDAFRRAIDLNPSESETYLEYVNALLTPQGRLDDALRVIQTAMSIDPSPYVRRVLVLIQVDSGHYDAAIENARRTIEEDRTLPWTHSWLARALYLNGRPDEALRVHESSPIDEVYLGYLYCRLGRRAEAEALAVKFASRPVFLMIIYAGLGDKERAFEAFERAVEVNWQRAAVYLHRPEMAFIHRDPRVRAIELQLGLPE